MLASTADAASSFREMTPDLPTPFLPPGGTAMDIHTASERGYTTAVREIVATDPSQVHARNRLNDQPLHIAAQNKRKKIVDLLLNAGADANAKGDQGRTPLHYAVWSDSNSVVNALLAHGANIGIKTEFGVTPLYLAASVGNTALTKQLLTNRSVPDLNSAIYVNGPAEVLAKLKATPVQSRKQEELSNLLWDAIRMRSHDLVRFLLDNGVNANAMVWGNQSPLLHAISLNDIDMVNLLIVKGADLLVKDHVGQPLLQYCESYHASPAIIALLRRRKEINYRELLGLRGLMI